jgi:NAD(P)-dependent dehydrogenase (short-subunit alcohol dehydrogenase family)
MARERNSNTVIVTGGSSGIGRATADILRESGWTVGVLSDDGEGLRAMARDYDTFEVDVRSADEVEAAVSRFAETHGKIDALVNSAGVSQWCPFLEMSEEFWDRIYDVNVKGTFLVSRAVAGRMVARGAGVIVNVASMSGLKSGMPRASAYASSKWAVVGFSRNLHLELKQHGVRVGCICPGSTLTDIHRDAGSAHQEDMLDPRDIGRAIAFMLDAPPNGHVQLLALPASFEEWK